MSGEQKGIKVLHVDDELDFLALTKAFFERENEDFSVDTAISAEEGLKLLKGGTYDVVVSDYKMPVMDGLAFLRNLRASGNTIPFIMFTGKGREEVAMEALNRGANGYLQKGVDVESMYGTLMHVIREEVAKTRAEDELQESEEKYRVLIENADEVIFVAQDGMLKFVNPKAVEVMVYSKEELTSRPFVEFIHPDDREMVVERHLKRLKGEELPPVYPFRIIDREGNTKWLEIRAALIAWEGRPATLNFLSDITERKRMENTLKEAEERYRTTFENTGTAMCVLEEDQTISLINKEFEKLSRYPREEIEGKKKWTEFVVKEDLDKMKTYHYERRKERKKAPTSYEFGFIDRKGNIKNIYLSVEVIPATKKSVCSLIDITERKRTEEELRLHSEIMTNMTEGVILTRVRDATIVYTNPKFEGMFGYGPGELVGKNISVVNAPTEKSPEVVAEDIQRVLKSTGVWSGDVYNITKDGTPFWCYANASQFDHPVHGTVWVSAHTDITERKRTEEALRESEERYRLLFNSSNDAVFVHPPVIDGEPVKFIEVNDVACQKLGYTREELLQLSHLDIIAPEQLGNVPAIREKLLEEKRNLFEILAVTKDGGNIPFEISTHLFNLNGEPAVLSIARDITERKQAEDALREREEKYRAIVENTHDLIYSATHDGTITYISPQVSNYGYTPEEIIGHNFFEFIAPEDVDRVYADLQRCLATGKEAPIEFRLVKKDGTFFDAEESDTFIREEDRIVGLIGVIRDVTERKKIEEALQASEREHQIILDDVPISIFHIDANSRFVRVNEVLAKRYGMKPDDFKGKTSKELFPEIGEEYVKSDKEVLESGEPQIGVTRKIKTPQGLRWVRLDKVPVKDADGSVTGIIGFELDITKRIEAQEELRNAHKELQDIIDFLPDATFVIDRDKKAIAWNRAMEEMTGVRKEDIIGKGDYAYAVPFYGVRRPILIDLIFLSDKEIESRYKYVKREGNTLFAEVFTSYMYGGKGAHLWGTATPLIDSEDNIVGAIESIRDITERKRAEEKLRESEEEYRSLVESTEDSVYLVDRDGRYLFMNDKHLSRIGLPKDQVIGRTYMELHSEDETEEFAEIVEEVFETGKSVQHEHRSRRDNRYILRTLSPVKDPEVRTTAVTVVSKDITERKRAEEERERLLKDLEAKNRELERFAYTVSHDLRSPLVTIQGFTGMLQNDLAQNEVEKAENDLTFIENAATKMDKLLSTTLQLSRIGRITNPPEYMPFGKIVEDALEQTAGEITSDNIEVSVADDFPTVHVDRMRITEVLVNLIGNSVRYRGDQPSPKIEIGHRMDNGERVFFVHDNGIGMDKSQHEKVFDLFYRVDESGKGTGAGLAIVKRIIEVHNGRIWIESEKGKGCTICFTLPVTEE